MVFKVKCRNVKTARHLKKECRARHIAFKMLDRRTLRIEAFMNEDVILEMLNEMKGQGYQLQWHKEDSRE